VSRLARSGLLVLVVLSVALTGRLGWIAYGPQPGPVELREQTTFLHAALDDGAAEEMQQLFPEGAFFLTALTASATAATADPDHELLRRLRDELDSPSMVAVFGSGMVPEHGIFHAGWSLSTAVDVAAVTGDEADRADVARRATMVAGALRGSRTGFLEGYPLQFWPCDTVVAAAGLSRAAVLLDRPDWLAAVRAWRDLVRPAADPAPGLLPHRVNQAGEVIEGPRGSSQSIIQVFWPMIDEALDGRPDRAGWDRFRAAFVTREAGVVGVREYPVGVDGPGDVDSGPLVLGISGSASTVTLAAARAHGDGELAEALNREAELLGLPIGVGNQRRYALGQLPVADAFLAWARSRPLPPADDAAGGDAVRPWWPALLGVALLPAAAATALLFSRRQRTAPVPSRP
jgi:hypothetical protein